MEGSCRCLLCDKELEDAVRWELGEWFGKGTVELWKLLRTYRIKFAQNPRRGSFARTLMHLQASILAGITLIQPPLMVPLFVVGEQPKLFW
ncbi:hypothetical protein GOP47_0000134 [Adiantum capillus-veneris]|uniref:Uncharacterized protein n=1 Tax=Adiantum capillus-veneris TaxID=13818 RepID=A0A9D4ZST8_ADICA|nr:hypothetical protein GOP47_0000134 [Adiantum capillus-veneris]